eukprot:8074703-Prorocentrum_lima.AAC.1
MGVPHDHSIPVMPRNNSWVECANRTVLEGARCLLLQAGLLSRFWPYAVRHFCLARNAIRKTPGGTPRFTRFGPFRPSCSRGCLEALREHHGGVC